MTDHYLALGVARTASAAEIKRAYRAAAKTRHPDQGGSADDFRALSVAYKVLSDPVLRRQHDEELARPSARATDEVWRAVEEVVGPIDQEAAADVLEALFGQLLDKGKRRVIQQIQDAVRRGSGGRK